MSFYTLLLRPIGTPLCPNQFLMQAVKDDIGLFKIFNPKRRQFMSSTARKKLKNFKSSKKKNSERQLNFISEATPFSFNLLVKPFLFTATFASASLAGAAIWQYENVRKKAKTLMKKSWFIDRFNREKKYGWRNKINKLWNQLTDGQKVFASICFFNVVVFLAWRVPRFESTMLKYFCSTPYSEAVCWPMFLSTFSHHNILHLVTNMYVLHGFSNMGVEVLGKEQFLGLYLASGVISSFFSYFYKAIIEKQTLSMGASGAVMGILGYICSKFPNTDLAIVFLPWIVFSASAGLKFLMLADTLGLIFRWKLFDHAAHLGAAVTGIAWCYWGNAYIWQKREPLLQWWHELRSTIR